MKKLIPILLLSAALLSLAACDRGSASQPDYTPMPSATPTNDELAIMAASDTDAAASVQSHIPPASSTDLEIDGEAYDKATACVGMTIFDLYTAIGQPAQTPVYTVSASQTDAQQGALIYKGFTVYTLRTSTEETVQRVELTLGDNAQPTTQDAAQTDQPADQSAVG